MSVAKRRHRGLGNQTEGPHSAARPGPSGRAPAQRPWVMPGSGHGLCGSCRNKEPPPWSTTAVGPGRAHVTSSGPSPDPWAEASLARAAHPDLTLAPDGPGALDLGQHLCVVTQSSRIRLPVMQKLRGMGSPLEGLKWDAQA